MWRAASNAGSGTANGGPTLECGSMPQNSSGATATTAQPASARRCATFAPAPLGLPEATKMSTPMESSSAQSMAKLMAAVSPVNPGSAQDANAPCTNTGDKPGQRALSSDLSNVPDRAARGSPGSAPA